MNALGEMGDFLTSSDSARDVENVAKSLGSAIGNVVGASIDSYQKAANGTSSGDPVCVIIVIHMIIIILLSKSECGYRNYLV